MTDITSSLIKTLRQRSGAGILDCQKALKASGGDIDKAFEALRKSGQAKAAKKAVNAVGEGIVAVKIATDQKRAAVIEINCQTDFVARNPLFSEFADQLLDTLLMLESEQVSVDNLLNHTLSDNQTVNAVREALVAKMGENIQITRVAQVNAKGYLFAYVHDKRIATLVDIEGGDEQLGKDIAMHVAASQPAVIELSDVPKTLLEKEKTIYMAQFANSDKPEAVREKIVEGKLQKFIKEVALVGQPFVKDPKQAVGDLLKVAGAKVHYFLRYQLGE